MLLFGLITLTLIINCSAYTYVDLGHEVNHDVPLFPLPGYLKNKFTPTVLLNETTEGGFWLAFNSFCTVEHVSTHLDAPYHFYEKGWTVNEIPLRHLVGPAVVIDVSAKAAQDPNYLITEADVKEWVAENGIIPNNSIILGRTDWSKKFNDHAAYLGHETDMTKLQFPGFGIDAIKYILNFKTTDNIDVVGFGIDTISLDHGPATAFDVHQVVQGANIYIIENMNNLEALPPKGATVFVMPVKITDGTGAPTRVIAQLPLPEEVTTLTSVRSDVDAASPSSVVTDGTVSTSPSTTTSTTTTTTTTTTTAPVPSEPSSPTTVE